MTSTDRKRLRELAEKASPAPWHIGHVSEIDDGSYEIDASNGELVCDNELPDNGLFIIAARTAVPQLLDLVEELERKKPTAIKEAVDCLTTALQADPEFYYAYQANIAMAFVDQFSRPYPEGFDLHKMANEAAKNFLDRLCK